MSIEALGGVTPMTFPSIDELSASSGIGAAGGAGRTGSTTGVDFAAAIDSLQGMQSTSDALAVKAVTGDLDDVHDYTIASAKAGVALELTAAIRNKAVDAFTEIMRMQA